MRRAGRSARDSSRWRTPAAGRSPCRAGRLADSADLAAELARVAEQADDRQDRVARHQRREVTSVHLDQRADQEAVPLGSKPTTSGLPAVIKRSIPSMTYGEPMRAPRRERATRLSATVAHRADDRLCAQVCAHSTPAMSPRRYSPFSSPSSGRSASPSVDRDRVECVLLRPAPSGLFDVGRTDRFVSIGTNSSVFQRDDPLSRRSSSSRSRSRPTLEWSKVAAAFRVRAARCRRSARCNRRTRRD